ncbi:MAG: DUF2007 domain-containing protein [Bacteroidales bacterium]|nr:DUF2007 domain-containing protein [Bacteroidales bacterium]
MEKGWIIAYTTNQEFQAEIFKEVLRDHGIEAQILNKMDSSYRSFGDIEVYVPDTHILKAKMLAKEFEQ